MSLAQIGPLTTALEAFATAVGAGMVVGGSVVGLYGLLTGWRRQDVRAEVFDAGYFGGALGALVAFTDVLMSYIVGK
jgi:hypothetical protein